MSSPVSTGRVSIIRTTRYDKDGFLDTDRTRVARDLSLYTTFTLLYNLICGLYDVLRRNTTEGKH